MQQAPRLGYYGPEDLESNDIKRILTKSGNRIQLADQPGNEAVTIATPSKAAITISEAHKGTGGRPLILISSEGDIMLSAPNGHILMKSKFLNREVG